MKKLIISLFICLPIFFISCDSETDPGGTEVEKMAGDWVVTWEYQEDGKWVDMLGGTVLLNTYNTAANVPTEMWLKEGYIINKAFKVNIDYKARTFAGRETMKVKSAPFKADIEFTYEDGKIIEGAATTPRGMPADSIVFYIKIKDDDTYKVAGFRRTGFEEDEH